MTSPEKGSSPNGPSPERIYAVWDVLQRASQAFLVLLQEVQLPLSGEEQVAHAARLEAIQDQVIRVSNDVHLMRFTVGAERRRGDRRHS
jgi:hypothetical protein